MLQTLRVRDFRCYGQLDWEVPERGALLLGDNAQGKTSLMEAICVGLALHSPRTGRLSRLIRHGSAQFGISMDTERGRRRVIWQARHMEMQVDGKEVRDFAQYLLSAPPVVWLGNQNLSLVNGAAEQRRDYLDFLGTQWHPEYRTELLDYKRALKSRNLLLRRIKPDMRALRSYAEVLAQHGERLMVLREELVRLLEPYVAEHHARTSGTSQEKVTLRYDLSARSSLLDDIMHALETDLRAGFTTVGPHRDDLQLSINGEPAAAYASEGQQRTLAVALMLAQASLLHTETGCVPTLLIDDVFGELDPRRRRALLKALPQDGQVFITATHLDWLDGEQPPLPLQKIHQAALV